MRSSYLGSFGRDYSSEDFYDDHFSKLFCSCCGENIQPGQEYFDVDGSIFCMRCDAEVAIFEKHRDEYLYEL